MGWSAFRKTGLTFHNPAYSFKGYTLLAPIRGDFAVLLDMAGQVVHRWRLPEFHLFQVRLLPDGNLLALCTDAALPPAPQIPFDQPQPPFADHIRRLGGGATHLKELTWDGALAWEYQNKAMHHDFVRQ